MGGFYVWGILPAGVNAKVILPGAVTEQVAYVPSTAFFADGTGQPGRRPLNWSAFPAEGLSSCISCYSL